MTLSFRRADPVEPRVTRRRPACGVVIPFPERRAAVAASRPASLPGAGPAAEASAADEALRQDALNQFYG